MNAKRWVFLLVASAGLVSAPTIWSPAACSAQSVRTVEGREWVEPEYREVTKKVWHPAVTETVREEIVVPPVFITRWINGRPYPWCLRPEHIEFRCRQVVVQDGYYEDVTSDVLVRAGHWITHYREE